MARTATAIKASKLPNTDNGWLIVAILHNTRSNTSAVYERRLRRFPSIYDTVVMPTTGRKLSMEEAREHFPDFCNNQH